MSNVNFKNNILLTGAGFSANFGGLLAKEMWSKILNNSKTSQLIEIKKILMKDLDFEGVYSKVMRSSDFSSEDKKVFQDIVLESYESMDENLRRYNDTGSDSYGIHFGGIGQLMGRFAGSNGKGEIGLHFTLNQDLFLERKLHYAALALTAREYKDYREKIEMNQISSKTIVSLPKQESLDNFISKDLISFGDLWYIKLHGSLGWVSSNGSNQIVIGTNKLEDIKKEPLLSWYFEILQQALYRQNVNLFVIGYGFKDQHINDYLLKAIKEFGVKLYIISPEDPQEFERRMEGRPIDATTLWESSPNYEIWKAVNGYLPYRLKEIFPSDQSETHAFLDLKKMLI